MVRRRAQMYQAPRRLLEFAPEEWPGRCVAEQEGAWWRAVRAHPAIGVFVAIMMRRIERLRFRHVECQVHPPQEFYPSSWTDQRDGIHFYVTWRDRSVTEEVVQRDSPRYVELMEAYWLRGQRPAPSLSREVAEELQALRAWERIELELGDGGTK
jgi:hypothetical protein